jgi:hypothetical protein
MTIIRVANLAISLQLRRQSATMLSSICRTMCSLSNEIHKLSRRVDDWLKGKRGVEGYFVSKVEALGKLWRVMESMPKSG